jgi:hypothetical protein
VLFEDQVDPEDWVRLSALLRRMTLADGGRPDAADLR